MYLLGISGSPRENGNTDLFLKKVLKSVECQSNFIALRNLNITPCDGCEGCRTKLRCHIQDDMSLIYKELKKVDAVILASPVYFGSISGQLKEMMDRTLCLYYGKQLENKIGAALATMGSDGGDLALHAINKFYQYHHIIFAGGVFGIGGIRKDAIMQDKRVIIDAKNLGKRILKLHDILKLASKA